MQFRYAEFDLLVANYLPEGWQEQIFAVSNTYSRRIYLDGKSSTSREPKGTAGTDYEVVLGDVVYREIQWLYQLYEVKFSELASKIIGGKILLAPERSIGVNINILRGIGSRYEWHVDTNPLTGVLFVTSHTEEDGGQLLFRGSSGDLIVQPKSGKLILFDAREIPHTVLPLKRDTCRISIPLNYYTPECTAEKVRPADLDSYIY
jgi:hypothetical protein